MEREKEKKSNNLQHVKSNYYNRRSYNKKELEDFTSVNYGVLKYTCRITEDDFNNLMINLDEIVDYITSAKEIDRKDNMGVARVMRIAYFEYTSFLAKIALENSTLANPNSNYRKNNGLVKLFNPDKKRDILDKYLRMYETHERNSGIDFYL